MAKAQIKAKEDGVPAGTKIIDLSVEKRAELYQQALKKFDEDGVATYGITMDVELVFNKKGVIPRLTLVDTLAQKNEQAKQAPQNQTKEEPKK